jgi:uncharacterized phage protein (TIGR02218 family)
MSIFDGELTRLAFCWRIERGDGAGLALTSHDRPLIIEGSLYEPSPGMSPAAVRAELGLDPRSSEVAGSLSSEAISEADLIGGRWDGAALRLSAVDWSRPDFGQHILLEGELGEVGVKNGQFEAELLGIAAELDRPICPVTNPECRAELGDPQCRVDMAGRRMRARVMGAEGARIRLEQPAGERFRFGSMRFLGGAANGLKRRIALVDGSDLTMFGAIPFDIEPGTPVELVEGCDKRLETCASRFGNAANFRGEPHLPGNDLLTRYPGA